MADKHVVDETGELHANDFAEIIEGKARILFPKSNTVFYNNVQVFNRDISVAVIKQFLKTWNNEHKEDLIKKTLSSSAKNKLNNIKYDTNNDKKNIGKDEKKSESVSSSNEHTTIVLEESVSNCNDITGINETVSCTILEALSATGLRAIRYALEIPNVNKIIANDLSNEAEKNILRNIKHNNVEKIVQSSLSDAR